MDKSEGRRRVRLGLLAAACGMAFLAAAAPAGAAYTSAGLRSGAVWTNYPGGYFLLHMDPLAGPTPPGAGDVMSYWLQGVVSSKYCSSGSYANVYAEGGPVVYTVTPTTSSGTITGTAYDSCAGFNRAFTVTSSYTVNGNLETSTDCCALGYNYLIADRSQTNGPGTATFQWASASTRDNTYMGGTYNNAGITAVVVASTS